MAAPIQPNAYQPDENLKKQRDQFFQNKRNESIQGANAQTQAGDDAIQRRFASMGASGSGAQIAALQKNRDAGMDAQRKAQADVGAMELQAGEADFGRSFQANEANAARQFQGSMADKDMAFKQKLADTDQGNKLKELDLAERQFALDKDTTAFNQRMAEIESGRPAPAGPLDTLGKNLQNLPKDVVNVGARGIAATLTGGLSEVIPQLKPPSCFLTTACVDVMGLKDDCWVLTLARLFRDSYMTETKDRAAEILEYYELAPKIVEKINLRPDAKKAWTSLFWKDVVPFVSTVDRGDFDGAHKIYVQLISKAKELAEMEA